MIVGWVAAALVVAILFYILATLWSSNGVSDMNPLFVQGDGSKQLSSIIDLKTKSEVEITERNVFAKADLIQKMVRGMVPLNGTVVDKPAIAKPLEPVDPETQPPDETAFMKAITDKVEQIKRLSKK